MAAKVKLFSGDKALCDIRPAQARYLVANGLAKRLQRGAVVLLCESGLKCGQEAAYELAAIETALHIVPGGLTRNEHQPAIIPRFKAARVPHG
jgi:hypothetical protein